MSADRGVRRHHAERLKQKWRKEFKWSRPWLGPWTDEAVAKALHTPAGCSCDVCARRRKYWGLSIQERRLFQREHDE